MGTEVLRLQDCLTERIGFSPVTFSHRRYGNAYPARCHRKPVRLEQRKRYGSSPSDPSISRRSRSPDDSKSPRKSLVMEKVTILRRGEPLDLQAKSSESLKEKGGGLIVTGTGRLGPGPEMIPMNIRIVEANTAMTRKPDVYAGSGFFVSPSPSSLPLPSFSKKQIPVDDSATRDLRRLLRLDL